jgi:hypothetical protein
MAEQTTPESARQPELQRQLAASQEEVRRLRNLLLDKDVEIGAVRGQLAVVEHQTQQLINLVGRIQARLPRLARLARAVVRRLRALRRG